MNFLNDYTTTFTGLTVILATVLIQQLIASGKKAKAPGAIPGKMDESLGHSSVVFRTQRTWMNSLENLPVMLGTVFLAVFVGADVAWTGILVWVYAGARIIHMVLYYAIATDVNPSPRSWFFLIGLVANIVLLGFCVAAQL
jgi:uncharacterized MAPEG superfamily protein